MEDAFGHLPPSGRPDLDPQDRRRHLLHLQVQLRQVGAQGGLGGGSGEQLGGRDRARRWSTFEKAGGRGGAVGGALRGGGGPRTPSACPSHPCPLPHLTPLFPPPLPTRPTHLCARRSRRRRGTTRCTGRTSRRNTPPTRVWSSCPTGSGGRVGMGRGKGGGGCDGPRHAARRWPRPRSPPARRSTQPSPRLVVARVVLVLSVYARGRRGRPPGRGRGRGKGRGHGQQQQAGCHVWRRRGGAL